MNSINLVEQVYVCVPVPVCIWYPILTNRKQSSRIKTNCIVRNAAKEENEEQKIGDRDHERMFSNEK